MSTLWLSEYRPHCVISEDSAVHSPMYGECCSVLPHIQSFLFKIATRLVSLCASRADGFSGLSSELFIPNQEQPPPDELLDSVLVVITPVFLNFILFNFAAAVVFKSLTMTQQTMAGTMLAEHDALQTVSVSDFSPKLKKTICGYLNPTVFHIMRGNSFRVT